MIKITNLIKFYIIILLYHHGPKYGYELIKILEQRLGRKINASHIYPFLKALKKNHYVNSKSVKQRDKKIYYLTKIGRLFAKSMLNRFGELIDLSVSKNLTVCAHCGCKLYKSGYKEKINRRLVSFCCRYCARAFKRH